MKKRELKKHVSAKDTDYYLMRLGLLEKHQLDHRELTADNLPTRLYRDWLSGAWFTVDDREVSESEVELFLRTGRTRSYVLRNNALIAGMVIALLIIADLAQDLASVLGG